MTRTLYCNPFAWVAGRDGSWDSINHQQSNGNLCGNAGTWLLGHSCGAHFFARDPRGPWRQSADIGRAGVRAESECDLKRMAVPQASRHGSGRNSSSATMACQATCSRPKDSKGRWAAILICISHDPHIFQRVRKVNLNVRLAPKARSRRLDDEPRALLQNPNRLLTHEPVLCFFRSTGGCAAPVCPRRRPGPVWQHLG